MYEGYYGLRERPFNLTPDPKYLYLSEKHKEAFAHLLFGIKNRSGFVMVTGEIGTGKTTICRTLLGQLDEHTEVAFIFNPCLSPEELLRKINEDFGIKTVATTVRGLIDELNAYLLEKNTKGKNCVLVIDEAQNLTPSVLEQIRLLSNLETETQKLLQIVLIGQPELMQVLALHELRQLNQRITARYHLHPLSRSETMQYVAYRMRVAGARRRIYFTPVAVKQVYKSSNGTPRVINALCDRALLIGYTKEARDITPAIVRQAAKEIRGEQPKRSIWPRFRAWLPNPAVITAGVAVLLLALFLRDRNLFAPGPGVPATNNGAAASTVSHPAAASSREIAFAAPVPAEKSVQVSSPPVSGPSDTSFAGLIDRQDQVASRNSAVQSLLRAWNLALLTNLPKDDSVQSLTTFADDNRLDCEILSVTLEQLEAINLPALIKLHGHSRSIWTALVGAQGDDLKIAMASTEATLVPRDRVAESYLNEAIVLWRDTSPETAVLKNGMNGEDVRVLQVQLRALGRLERAPTGTFDGATAEAIRTIQRETGQNADGVAGKRTRMVLSSWLPGFNTPGLRAMPAVLLDNDDGADTVPRGGEAPDAKAATAKPDAATGEPARKKEARTAPKRNSEKKLAAETKATRPATPSAAKAEPETVNPPASPLAQLESASPPGPAPPIATEELPKPGEPQVIQAQQSPAAGPVVAVEAPAITPVPVGGQTQDSSPAWTGGLLLVPDDAAAAGATP
ncbi:MAG: AAA family ATPase [Candidatus Hydrogenedentes bacterium]|nr:AAA family ATPase [Candidatus Hydrogenedentota bacterium]